MYDSECPSWTYPFPRTRPEVDIRKSAGSIAAVDCRELLWWFVIPEVGNHTAFAGYDADTLELAEIMDLRGRAPAQVDGIECVEVQARNWRPRGNREQELWPEYVYGVVGTETVRWVAVVGEIEGKRRISTGAEAGFGNSWRASCSRRIQDCGHFRQKENGSYVYGRVGGSGAGVYDVRIGANTFRCLRVLDVSEKGGELVEAYIEPAGRTVFFRRYDGRYYRGADLAQQYPRNRQLTIDGEEYVHCDCSGKPHDTITDTALGSSE